MRGPEALAEKFHEISGGFMYWIVRRISPPPEVVESDQEMQAEAVQRFIKEGHSLGQKIGAFNELPLTAPDDPQLFARRLSIALFHTFSSRPWPYSLLLPRGKNDEIVSLFVEENTEIETEFKETDNDWERCAKRAIDYAARDCASVISQNLENQDLSRFQQIYEDYGQKITSFRQNSTSP